MSPTPYAVLETAVNIYRESDGPVTATAVATSLGVSTTVLEEPLESLRECELLDPVPGGYRPTVTAYELLELNIDPDDILVLDPVEE